MSQIKSILKNSAFYTILGFLPAAANFFMVPLLTTYLSTDEYGLLSVSTMFQGIIGVFMLIGLDAALSRFYFRYYKRPKLLHATFSTGFIFILSLALIMFLILSLFGENIMQLLFKNERFHFHDYGVVSFFLALSSILNTILLAYYRNEENVKVYARMSILSLLAIIVGVLIGVVYLRQGAYGNIMGRAVGMSIMVAVYLGLFFRKKPIIFRLKSLKPMLKYGLPFVPYFFLLLANSSLDQWLLERRFDLDQLGEYNFALQFASLCSVFTYAIYNAIGPKVYKLMTEDETGYKNEKTISNLLRLFHLIVVFVIVSEIALIAPVIELIIKNQEYHNVIYFINLLILVWLVHLYYMLYSIPMMFYNKTRFLPLITLIGFIVGVGSNLILIPYWGVIGICASVIAIKFAVFISAYWIGRQQKVLHLEYYQLKANHITAVLVFLSVIVSYWLAQGQGKEHLYWINLLPFAVFAVCCATLFRNDFKQVISAFSKKSS